MLLSLAQTQALNELAELLYSFLPGKAHPLADQDISFESIAASLNLSKFWSGGSKLPAVSQLLTKTYQYQSNVFCPLIIKIVQTGMLYRRTKNKLITRDEIERLNTLIAQVGFKIPELHDPKFLDGLPKESFNSDEKSRALPLNESVRQELKAELVEISTLTPQERGFRFEEFMAHLFDAFNLAPRKSFRLTGEQIDGSFKLEGETYLLEATWQSEQIGEEKLLIFQGKVSGKAQWSRGLLISYSGFSIDGMEAFAKGKRTNIVCMDGLDLYYILEGKLDLRSVLEQKVSKAAETNQACVSVRELFPNIV